MEWIWHNDVLLMPRQRCCHDICKTKFRDWIAIKFEFKETSSWDTPSLTEALPRYRLQMMISVPVRTLAALTGLLCEQSPLTWLPYNDIRSFSPTLFMSLCGVVFSLLEVPYLVYSPPWIIIIFLVLSCNRSTPLNNLLNDLTPAFLTGRIRYISWICMHPLLL